MIQTQWPGLGSNLDVASFDAAAGTGRALWPDGPYASAPAQPGDAVAPSWWSCGTANANGAGALSGLFGTGGAPSGALFGVVSGLVTALQQLVGALLNQSTAPGGAPHPPPAQQFFRDVDVSSSGDPHIAEVGTRAGRGGDQPVDAHWDSMTAHDDLVHSGQIEGGYRVSTAVTPPNANGVTSNQSATVNANFGQDAITMQRDGSYQIVDDGREVALGKGESATLSGGERVDVNQDGSLTVSASTGGAGTISTTLRATGAGVDVATHGHDIALGGDAIVHGVTRPRPRAPLAQPARTAPAG